MKLIAKCFLLLILFLFSTQIIFATQLANYIGTGSNPRIQLVLSQNGPSWNSFTIDYQSTGNVPYSNDPTKNWSTWDAKDTNGNYYGTFTLTSDGNTVSCGEGCYRGGTGYYFKGVHFKANSGNQPAQITVDAIVGGNGPFPDTPKAMPAMHVGTTHPIILNTQGPYIVDDLGHRIILKGVVRPSLEWNPQGQYLSANDITQMKKWGANVIRLDLNQSYWLNSGPVTQTGSYKQIIDAIIYNAIQNNMAIILDLHWLTQNQSPMANSDSLTFWQQVASTYKNFGTVIFELYNEPFLPDVPYAEQQKIWLNGGNYDGQNYVGYQQLYDAIRSTGANNLVIINGLDYGYDLSFVNANFKVNGTNVIYGSHPYDDKGSDNYSGQGGSLANNFKNILENYPIIFTEFGDNQAGDYPNGVLVNHDAYTRNLDFLNENAGNYTAFAWWVEPGNPAFPSLISDWSGTPLNGGVDVHNDLINHAPSPLN